MSALTPEAVAAGLVLSPDDALRLFTKFSQAADFTTERDCRIHDSLRIYLSALLQADHRS